MSGNFRILQSLSEFQQLGGIWDNLLQTSPADNYFLTWDWVWTWWQIYSKKDDTLAIGVLEYQNNITGIVPCYIRKKRLFGPFYVRTLYFLGTQSPGPGEVCPNYMDFIYTRGEEQFIVEKFLSEIVKSNICDELCFSRMNYRSPIFKILQNVSVKHKLLALTDDVFECPVAKLPTSWDEYIQSLSSSMRYKIRREQRKLQLSQNTVFSQPINETEAARYFEELIQLHQKRWNDRNQRGSFANEQFTAFHKRMIQSMFKKEQLALTILFENNEAKAAVYNIRYKNKIYFYQSGVLTGSGLPAFGYLIHSYCIEDAIKNSLDEYDFLLEGRLDAYKRNFTNTQRQIGTLQIYQRFLLQTGIRLKEWLRPYYRMFKRMKDEG
ncbi:MAG: GNAT family N-acetyltransferase [Chitinispirillaceae bacterium]|nr:GNAT family N-acetyltransferase [Chitinispirillaceae bacterium]